MTAPSIGLALIAKDEEETLPHLLASIEGAFDQVALVDTGSTDRTVEVFEAWAEAEQGRHPDFRWTLDHFEWCDDFAAARNHADSLLDTDWLCWADCDDTIVGAGNLRRVVARAPDRVKKVVFDYYITLAGSAEPVVGKDYVRLLRRGYAPPWTGRMHEWRPNPDMGELLVVNAGVARWVTRRSPSRPSSLERNVRILRRWVADEPKNLIPRRLVVAEELMFGDVHRALRDLDGYLKLKGPSMTTPEARMARYGFHELKQVIENESHPIPLEHRGVLKLLLVIATGLPPEAFTSQLQEEAEVKALKETETAPVERKTRQQRRAEARARAKELVAA